MANIGIVRPFQLRVRNPMSPPGFGINYTIYGARKILDPLIKANLSTALTITTQTPLQQFKATKKEKTINDSAEAHFGEIGSASMISFCLSRIRDDIRKVFVGMGTMVTGIVQIENSIIGENCYLSGDSIPEITTMDHLLLKDSTIGPGNLITGSGIIGTKIAGSLNFNAVENNPFSAIQTSQLSNSELSGRFGITGSIIDGLKLINESDIPQELDFVEMDPKISGQKEARFSPEEDMPF